MKIQFYISHFLGSLAVEDHDTKTLDMKTVLLCREQERRRVYLVFTDISTVVVVRERIQRPSEHASLDIFNADYLWEYGA